jgi:hypothetical protein
VTQTTTSRNRSSTRSTVGTSRRSDRVRRPPSPFTVEHFRVYASVSVLDNGDPFELEDFQLDIAKDIFAGYPEIWLVIPEGNGKTTFLAELALYFGDYTPSAMIPIAASSREQAEIMYRQAEGLVARSPELKARFRAYDGYRRIKCHRTSGRIQVYAADDRTGDGIIPVGLALVDELHRHRDLKLYRTWRGKLDKADAQIVTISTAGEPGSEFEETRERIKSSASDSQRSGCHTRAASEDIVLHDYAVPKRSQADDMDVVAEANPRGAITAGRLGKKFASPTMTREHWLRFVCNIATRASSQPITQEDWDPLRDERPVNEGLPGFGWVDLGWKIDTTAMGVVLWESNESRVIAGVKVLEPPVDEADIVRGLLDLWDRFPSLTGIVFDPNAGAQQMRQMLEKGEHPVQQGRESRPILFVEHSQDNAPMSLAASRFDEALRSRWLRWAVEGDHQALRRHVLNAARKDLGGEKWRYDRPADAKGERRRKYPIDALTGASIGHSVAVAELAQAGGGFEW